MTTMIMMMTMMTVEKTVWSSLPSFQWEWSLSQVGWRSRLSDQCFPHKDYELFMKYQRNLPKCTILSLTCTLYNLHVKSEAFPHNSLLWCHHQQIAPALAAWTEAMKKRSRMSNDQKSFLSAFFCWSIDQKWPPSTFPTDSPHIFSLSFALVWNLVLCLGTQSNT